MVSRCILAASTLACCQAWAQSSNVSPAPAHDSSAVYQPITSAERGNYYLHRTYGPLGLAKGIMTSGIQTWRHKPQEWGRTPRGFGYRLAARQGRVVVSNTIELGIGTLLQEDPRYFSSPRSGFFPRVQHAFVSTFTVRTTGGGRAPALGRMTGLAGSRFIAAHSWNAHSDSQNMDAVRSTGYAIGFDFAFNVLREFWPDIKKKLRR